MNITGTILSKRKIAKLVNEGYVRGWDDPRLYTLEAIKRRGVPPGAILTFINTLGVTTSTTNIQVIRLESAVRSYLDNTTPRLMLLLEPLLCEVVNVDEGFGEEVEVSYKPGAEDKFGSRKVKFTKKFYIDRSDYRDETDKEYFRLAPGQPVGLMKVPYNVSVHEVIRDEAGNVTKLLVNYESGIKKKPKTYIQWVGENNVRKIKEIRMYNQLFKSENPSAHPDGFLKDINDNSEEIIRNSIIEAAGFEEILKKSPLNIGIEGSEFNINEAAGPHTVRFQALRIGYFCMDKDSSEDSVVLNRIVTLKEDAAKA